MSELQTLKTAIHEVAHSRLHDVDLSIPKDEQNRVGRRTREVEAESIAYTVCAHYGLDTSDYSFGYVAGWSSGKELTELKASLETVRTTAAELIKNIDGHFAELTQTREAEQQTPVFDTLPPEQQQALSDEVQATLQFFVDTDIKDHGELTESTLEAIAVQGYEYRDGQLEKMAEQQPIKPEQQPGHDEYSELATAENAPENPGEPSDDIDAYLLEQENNVDYAKYTDVWQNYIEITGFPISIQVFYQDVSDGTITNQLLNSPYVISDTPNYEYKEDSPHYQRAINLVAEIRDIHHNNIFRELEQDEQPPDTTEPITATPYYSIDEATARRAKEMNSYRDYTPGSATAEYRQMVDKAVAIAENQKKHVDPMHHERIDSLLNTYAQKLAENMNNSNSIDTRMPSIMIAGPSNFSARKKEKQNNARDRNMEDWRDIEGLLDKIRSVGMGGISADDPNAVSKLETKLAGIEQSQETMKTANAYYRKHKTLDGCPVLSPEQIQKLTSEMANRWYGREARQPFEPYSLQNNNAEINRLKNRIASLKVHEKIDHAGWEFDGGRVEANKDANRLQVFFDEKPDAATRDELKSNGFRWSPKATPMATAA